MFKAVLSTTLLQNKGVYAFEPLDTPPDISGVTSYVGHPATAAILEGMGAKTVKGQFAGLEPGESFVCAQLKDPRKGNAWTVDQPVLSFEELKFGIVTRIS